MLSCKKLSCLDKASDLPDVELNLDWEKRSDLVCVRPGKS